mmetsp:Transcript_212/g.364  ORF Transcript_212/g.364 Transcript_212/m.364 type:complete len:105 (-) Transcript_212:1456-1770(-)
MSLTSQGIQITPWQDHQELDDTFSCLLTAAALHNYGNVEMNVNLDHLHDAVQRVAVWRARGEMVHSVEISGSLAELLLRDYISTSLSSSGGYLRYDDINAHAMR